MRVEILIMIFFLLAAFSVSAVDDTLYHRCTDDVSVDINNNTFTINMPGRTVDLTCGQQLTRNYNIEFYEDITAQCKSDEILENFTHYFETFGNNFQTFMNSYNMTPGYYDKYLVCSSDLSAKSIALENCKAQETKKDYKTEFDTCTSEKIVLQGEKNQAVTANQQCQTELSTLKVDSSKYKDQRLLFFGAGLIIGALAMNYFKRKDRKIAESPAQRQLPSSR